MRRLLAALVLVAGFAPAQSWFNTQGLGEIGRTPDAYSAGLGAAAALGWQNPAWLIRLPQARITAAMLATGTLGSDNAGNRFIGTVRPAGFYGAVPLPVGLRLSVGIDETFNQDFDVWTESLPDNPYRYHVTGRGGVYALRAAVAWSFLDAGCVGVQYARQLGASREDWRLEAAGGTYVSTDTVETDYSANSLRAGVAGTLGRFGFGAWFEPGLDYRVQTIRRVHGTIGDSITERSVGLPWTATAGLRVAATDRLEFTAGAEYRPWSGIKVENGLNSVWRDALRLAGGVQFAFDTLHAVRVGYSHEDWYYDTGWGEQMRTSPVSEHRLHLGTGVPIRDFGSLDFALELARRDNGALTEYAGRFVVSLAYREAWLKRTRRWGY